MDEFGAFRCNNGAFATRASQITLRTCIDSEQGANLNDKDAEDGDAAVVQYVCDPQQSLSVVFPLIHQLLPKPSLAVLPVVPSGGHPCSRRSYFPFTKRLQAAGGGRTD